MRSWHAGLLAVATWFAIHLVNDFGPRDTFFPPVDVDMTVEEHYSETYHQARALFRQRAEAADAALHTLPLEHLAHLDLSVDVAVIKGATDHILIHFSGTHGVEGFAGSAIQSDILKQAASKNNEKKETTPTVILVHAVNPYGFSQLRRFNENNVDLNRNWLSDAEFKALAARDPNRHGYLDVNQLLNPTTDPWNWNNWFWPRAAYEVLTKGFKAIKQAVVTGNYHLPKSIFYGGDRMEPSLVAIKEFLAANVDFAAAKKLAVIDVHTGLGKSGEDTLMVGRSTTEGVAEQVFRAEYRAQRVAPLNDLSNPVVQGYEDVRGLVADGVAVLLPDSSHCRVVSVVQEFGTVPGVFVLKAMAQENAFFQYAPSRRLPYAERIRDVFYTHASPSWKQSVLARGVAVYDAAFAYLTT